MFTQLSLAEYFQHPEFSRYFLNTVGFIQYELPSVFLDNPNPVTVNGSLWTVPFEMLCYLVMAFLIISGAVRNGMTLLMISAAIILIGMLSQWIIGSGKGHSFAEAVLQGYIFSGKGPPLLPCFVLGAACYVLRDRIPFDKRIFCGCVIALIAIGLRGHPGWWTHLSLVFLISPIMIYIVTFVGLSKVPKLPIFSTGDYSYGIYLYGFPIQQALANAFPAFRSMGILFFISLVIVTLFAMVSWHFIEKPILKMRKRFSLVGKRHDNEQQRASEETPIARRASTM